MKRLLQKNMLGAFSLVLGLLVLPCFAQAESISGVDVFVNEGGTVSVAFSGSSESFEGTLYLEDHGKLFSSNVAAGTTINVGEYEAGKELNFFILGKVPANKGARTLTFSRAHITKTKFVVKNIDSGTYTGIEGNNLVQNPEPSTIVLLGSGLLGLGAWRLRKKKA